MTRLSRALDAMKPHYTVVVVGSGYGASIAASRLARAGQSVCLLERGREIPVGQYPNNPVTAAAEFQVHFPGKPALGKATGLYDVRVSEDISVTQGCGLGGTSLINANVAIEPEPRVFADPRWPAAFRADLQGLKDGFARAREMLQPVPYPNKTPLPKLEAHRKSAAQVGGQFGLPPIAVTFEAGVNKAGVHQAACELCGDCCSGCNVGAKNTLLMNYLPDAVKHGAEIYTQALVHRVSRDGDKWRVHFATAADSQGLQFGGAARSVTADCVFLGAGALGSTEILLRSKANGLPVSEMVGQRFTSNGDVLGFAFNADVPINGMGFGLLPKQMVSPVGPTITSIIDKRQQANLDDGFVIEEGAIPGALAGFMQGPLTKAAGFPALDSRDEVQRLTESMLFGPYRGALKNTQTYLVMAHDDGAGRMTLQNDHLRIQWPGVGRQAIFKKVNDSLRQAAQALGATFVPNPAWRSDLLGNPLITVHPLGGCVMGESAADGVVNDRLQVFAGAAGDAVHAGLYVVDGAVMPRSLGVNPFLTICAVAERAVAKVAAQRGWPLNYD